MRTANLLSVIRDPALRQELTYLLSEMENAPLSTEGDCDDWKGIVRQTERDRPDVLLVEVAALPPDLTAALRTIRKTCTQTKIIAVHQTDDPAVILAALRAGANEFVSPRFEDTLPPALERVVKLTEEDHTPGRQGKVVGFLSAKGGCGSTTLACHIAADLRRRTNKQVLLVDLDLTSGMVGFLMKVNSTYSVLDAVANLSRLDESLWKALKTEWKPGIDVVPSPDDFSYDRAPSRDEWRQLIKFMRTQYDWIVLDLGRSLNQIAATLYGELDELFLISVLEVSALHGLKTIAQKLRDAGEDLTKLELVLNRTPKMMDITQDELQKVLGRPLYAMLPNDYPSLYQSYSTGTLLPPENRLAQHFSQLTAKLAGIKAPVMQKKKFSLFA